MRLPGKLNFLGEQFDMSEEAQSLSIPAAPAAPVSLPWPAGQIPLMLAPMQGLTNRAMRSLFIDWVRPDLVFTEFMRTQ